MRLAMLLLCVGGVLFAEEGRPFSDEEIQRHLDTFDQSYEDRKLPEADVVATLENLKNAYLFLKAREEPLTQEQARFPEEILGRVTKGLVATRRPIVNIECARVLGKLGDPKGLAPLVKWLGAQLSQATRNPQAVEYGFLSIAWIGPKDQATFEMVLSYAKGGHEDSHVALGAIKACAQWRELDGEARKKVFDGICSYLEKLVAAEDEAVRKRYYAIEKEGLQALRELSGNAVRFERPAQARAWFANNTKWEKYVGPRFR